MEFKIVTPHGTVYEDSVDKVAIPTQAGEIVVLENHAPIVSVLQAGELIIYKDKIEIPLAVAGGVLEVRPTGEVYVMADAAERAEHIDLERAEAARARAEELMKQKDATLNIDFARLQAKIEKEMARLSVGNKYKK